MLELTDDAVSMITTITERAELPDGAGLKIAVVADGSAGMTATATTGPDAGDLIVVQGGAQVFLTPAAAKALGDKVLDARIDETGRVGFLVAPRRAGGSS